MRLQQVSGLAQLGGVLGPGGGELHRHADQHHIAIGQCRCCVVGADAEALGLERGIDFARGDIRDIAEAASELADLAGIDVDAGDIETSFDKGQRDGEADMAEA